MRFGKSVMVAVALTFATLTSGCVTQPVMVERPVPRPPPAVRYEPIPPPPGPAEIWVWQPGHWRWDGFDYHWQPGHYVRRPAAGAYWEAPHWVPRPGGWIFLEGRWR